MFCTDGLVGAVTTRANLRLRLRRALEDTDGANPVWSDTELNDFLATAALDYALRFPKLELISQAVTSANPTYAMPAQVLGVERVILPTSGGCEIPRRESPVSSYGSCQSWYFDGANLQFGEAPGQDGTAYVWCRTAYQWPSTDGGDSTMPAQAEDVVVWSAAVQALERREVASAKRRQGVRNAESQALISARGTLDGLIRRCRRVRSSALVAVG